MGQRIKGDADDYVLDTFGIPSVTAELGVDTDFVNDWVCKGGHQCYTILQENSSWVEFILLNIEAIAKMVKVK